MKAVVPSGLKGDVEALFSELLRHGSSLRSCKKPRNDVEQMALLQVAAVLQLCGPMTLSEFKVPFGQRFPGTPEIDIHRALSICMKLQFVVGLHDLKEECTRMVLFNRELNDDQMMDAFVRYTDLTPVLAIHDRALSRRIDNNGLPFFMRVKKKGARQSVATFFSVYEICVWAKRRMAANNGKINLTKGVASLQVLGQMYGIDLGTPTIDMFVKDRAGGRRLHFRQAWSVAERVQVDYLIRNGHLAEGFEPKRLRKPAEAFYLDDDDERTAAFIEMLPEMPKLIDHPEVLEAVEVEDDISDDDAAMIASLMELRGGLVVQLDDEKRQHSEASGRVAALEAQLAQLHKDHNKAVLDLKATSDGSVDALRKAHNKAFADLKVTSDSSIDALRRERDREQSLRVAAEAKADDGNIAMLRRSLDSVRDESAGPSVCVVLHRMARMVARERKEEEKDKKAKKEAEHRGMVAPPREHKWSHSFADSVLSGWRFKVDASGVLLECQVRSDRGGGARWAPISFERESKATTTALTNCGNKPAPDGFLYITSDAYMSEKKGSVVPGSPPQQQRQHDRRRPHS